MFLYITRLHVSPKYTPNLEIIDIVHLQALLFMLPLLSRFITVRRLLKKLPLPLLCVTVLQVTVHMMGLYASQLIARCFPNCNIFDITFKFTKLFLAMDSNFLNLGK